MRVVVGARQQRLEELQRHAEAEVALELGAAGAQDGDAGAPGARDGGVQQGRLADPGVTVDEQQLTRRAASRRQQFVDRAQGLFSLEKLREAGVTSCDWGAVRQKTGEPP